MSLALDAKIAAARAVSRIARRAGRGGTSLPGKVLVRLDSDAIASLAGRLTQGSVVISATNGKTTTATMAASVLEAAGIPLVHNRAGANMAGGVASALLSAVYRSGIDGELGLFEIDEFWLDRLSPQLHPRALVLGNLFRDQLDRYGELEAIADRWAAAVSGPLHDSALVLNADDPLIADLGREAERVVYFGIEDTSVALPQMQHAADSKHCRRCGHAYAYETIYLGHLGRYLCPNCGRTRPDPSIAARSIELDGTRTASFDLVTPDGMARITLPLPGLYNVYNALGAAALCLDLGVDLPTVRVGLERVQAAFGRAEVIRIAGHPARILLIKNPAGANEILRTLALEDGSLSLLVILNDRIADGRDISWIWDADFELLAGHAASVTCAGTRAAEMALRLKYAGAPETSLSVVHGLSTALDQALGGLGEDSEPEQGLFILPTYTALLELREELAARGASGRFWERQH